MFTKVCFDLMTLNVNSKLLTIGKLTKLDVSMPVRMHLALDNENEPAWVEVKNLKDIVGGVSPNSQVSPELGTVAPQLWRQQSKPPLLVQTRVASCITAKYFVSKLADNIFVF